MSVARSQPSSMSQQLSLTTGPLADRLSREMNICLGLGWSAADKGWPGQGFRMAAWGRRAARLWADSLAGKSPVCSHSAFSPEAMIGKESSTNTCAAFC